MMINKDTKLFGSFSKNPGNRGCQIFNAAFRYHQIDAIYKSYQISDIKSAVEAARTLGFSGFAVSMPFKKSVLEHIDIHADTAILCGSANTIVESSGILKAHNTDFLAVKQFLENVPIEAGLASKALIESGKYKFCVLGNGGYASAVISALNDLNLEYEQIVRSNWHCISEAKSTIMFNCTPVKNVAIDDSCSIISSSTETPTGRRLGLMQASYQYALYTGKQFPFHFEA